ncbi:MAG: hypothetical protein PGN13_10630 [Patulibacter minatonensis]
MRRSIPLILSALVALLGAPTAASAAADGPPPFDRSARSPARTIPILFGIGDQHATMFADTRWQALDFTITRLNVPWNATSDPALIGWAEDYVRAARDAGVETLVHVTGRAKSGVAEPLPSVAAYRRSVGQLVARLRPLGVHVWGAWNEANHLTQPTALHPERAARFARELRRLCADCTIVAADVLVQGGPGSRTPTSYRPWLRAFLTAYGARSDARLLIGMHNYGELIVSSKPTRARDLIRFVRRTVPSARFWITESGGIAASRDRPCDERRQVVGQRRMFAQAARLAPAGVERLYAYSWSAATCASGYDSGLIRPDGTSRPALAIVERWAPRFAR